MLLLTAILLSFFFLNLGWNYQLPWAKQNKIMNIAKSSTENRIAFGFNFCTDSNCVIAVVCARALVLLYVIISMKLPDSRVLNIHSKPGPLTLLHP